MRGSAKAEYPLDLVYSDLAEPIDPASKDDYKYCMVFVDDFSGASNVFI